MTSQAKTALRAAFVDTIPVLTGYLFLGAGFGILLSESGYGAGWALLMSLCIYAGSGQYLLVSLLSSGASLISTAVATLLVNVRHLFYGISLVDTYQDAGKKKLYMIFGRGKQTPALVVYLGKVLPYAIMGMLVVYCPSPPPLMGSPKPWAA